MEETETKLVQCPRCKGKMMIKDYQKDCPNKDGMMPCPDCEGDGTVGEEYAQEILESKH